ncbi:MAG: Maf family protein, partial [Pseudomonadota bacterium]|nr:Maf family protein [Pseudomonadota bacterium]
MTTFILASASPRRLQLLGQIGLTPAKVIHPEIDETPHKAEIPGKYALRIAGAKAAAIATQQPDSVILAADTVAAAGRRILPKAEDEKTARKCLELLSGRRHRVYTAVCVISPLRSPLEGDQTSASLKDAARVVGGICNAVVTPRGSSVVTDVTRFRPLPLKGGAEVSVRLVMTQLRFLRLGAKEIDAYIATGEWRGKAGGYGIQGKAEAFIPWMSGSYSNVVG